MSRTTGPILAAGALTWTNQVLLNDNKDSKTAESMWTETVRIGVATGILVGVMNGFERIAEPIAVSLAWTALATVLLVRFQGKPTPLEKLTSLAGG